MIVDLLHEIYILIPLVILGKVSHTNDFVFYVCKYSSLFCH